ncbi:MAG: hypothetical protein U5L11_03965 [Arhodomonas sp.]|nr:hypothetical protein [Arhodomonas sp.]
MTTQTERAALTSRSRAMAGRATLTMLPSSTAMITARATVTTAHRRRGMGRPSVGVAGACSFWDEVVVNAVSGPRRVVRTDCRR